MNASGKSVDLPLVLFRFCVLFFIFSGLLFVGFFELKFSVVVVIVIVAFTQFAIEFEIDLDGNFWSLCYSFSSLNSRQVI